MDTFYALLLSPLGRALLLSVAIGLVCQGLKTQAPKGSWLRALLPLWSILLGLLASLIPGVLTGEAATFLGLGAGALSSTTVEIWGRYKDQLVTLDLKKLASKGGAGDR